MMLSLVFVPLLFYIGLGFAFFGCFTGWLCIVWAGVAVRLRSNCDLAVVSRDNVILFSGATVERLLLGAGRGMPLSGCVL